VEGALSIIESCSNFEYLGGYFWAYFGKRSKQNGISLKLKQERALSPENSFFWLNASWLSIC
jgi:hypothetical protein